MELISRSNFKMLEVPITRLFFILSLLMHTASVSAKTDNLRDMESLSMSDGWAIDKDESNAVKKAADMLETATPNHAYSIKNPKFLVAYFTQEFSGEKLASAIEKRYPGVPVFGFSVLKAVFTTDGMHMGEEGVEGALALMGFDSAGLKVGVAIQDVKTGLKDTTEDNLTKDKLMSELINKAMANAPVEAKIKKHPSLILMATEYSTVQTLLNKLRDTFPIETPLSGGTPIDSKFGYGFVIGNGRSIKPAGALALLYTTKKIGTSFHGGYVGKKKSGKITRVKEGKRGVDLATIDNRPAMEVYNEWSDGYYSDVIQKIKETGKPQDVMKSTIKPMAKLLKSAEGDRYITIHPHRFHPDGSLTLALTVYEGDDIFYVEGSKEVLVKRAGSVVTQSMVNGKIKKSHIAGGLHLFCGGAGLGMGLSDNGPRMVAELQQTMPQNSPFIGGFTGGEQGNLPGLGFFEGNLMSTMVVFEK